MPESHLRAELHQPGLGGRRLRPGADAEALGGSPHQHRVADRIGRRELHQAPGLERERVQLPAEGLLEPPRQPARAGQCPR